MAAPNLQSPTTVTGKTAPLALANTTETALLTNAASSNRAFRVKSITASNSSTSLTCDVTLRFYNAASAGTGFAIGPIMIPASGSVILIGAENPIWIEEDRRLTAQSSASNQVTILCSYEEVL